MPRFIKGLARGCPNLEHLALIFHVGVQKGVLNQLYRITSLKTLTLIPKQLSYEDAVPLANCRGLKKLSLYGINPAPDAATFLRYRISTFTWDTNVSIPLCLCSFVIVYIEYINRFLMLYDGDLVYNEQYNGVARKG